MSNLKLKLMSWSCAFKTLILNSLYVFINISRLERGWSFSLYFTIFPTHFNSINFIYYINFNCKQILIKGLLGCQFLKKGGRVLDIFCNFYFVKNPKFVIWSKATGGREKISKDLESLEFAKTIKLNPITLAIDLK